MHMLIIALVMMVVSFVLQSFMAQKQQKKKPEALEDWDFPQKDEGTPQPVFFGDCWTDGPTVIWYGNYRTTKIKAGGKK
jgi:hypothetical protein